MSASACSVLSAAPTFLPTSTSAISMETISNAVPASSPLASTTLEMESGFSSTAAWVSAEPMVVTIPSPTRAIMVSSPAPPTSLLISALTVTCAVAMTCTPFLATAAIGGVLITLGLTLICTASRTFLPARSIAAARSKGSGIPALSAEIKAVVTLSTSPPAR